MNLRDQSWMRSIEVCSGLGLIVAGVAAQVIGLHTILTQALVPFGVGLILSEYLPQAAKSARERVKVRVRRDDE